MTLFKETRRLDIALAATSLLLGLFAAGTMVAVGYLNYTRFPWFDGWAYWTEYLNASSPWQVLFDRMNEHRIVVTRLLTLADTTWFRADARLLLWSSFATQFGSAALLYRMATSSFDLSTANRVYAAGLILTFAFAAPQWINFTWTFLTCFLVVPFGAMAAFILLKDSVSDGPNPRVDSWRVVASMAMALLSTGSMSNGLLVWPLLLAFAATLRLPWKVTAGIGLATVVVFLAYMSGEPIAQRHIAKSLMKPLQLAPFALAFLGSAFDEPMMLIGHFFGRDLDRYRIPAAALVGAIGLALTVYVAVDTVRKRPNLNRHRLAMLYTLAFFVASSALIALGRVQLSLIESLTSRYVTSSLLFWACLLLMVTSRAATSQPSHSLRRYVSRVVVLVVACLVGGFPQLPKVAYAAATERFLAEGEYALINRVFAVEAWYRFYMTPGEMIATVRYFRDRRLSSFSREWTSWIGDEMSAHYALANPSACVGDWDSSSPVGGSYTPAVLASGWAFDRQFNKAPDLIVFRDDSQRIVGYTSGTRLRPDVAAVHAGTVGERVGWIAYLPAGEPVDLTAYVVLGDGRSVCKVGGARLPGIYLTAAFSKAGPVIPGVNVSTQGDWTKDTLPSPAPGTGTLGESWSSRAVTVGDAVLRIGPVPCGSGASIGLPLVTSVTRSRSRVSVVERDTRVLLAATNPPPGLASWDLWRLDVPVGAPAMSCDYIVEDMDNDRDSWIAAGLPRTINR